MLNRIHGRVSKTSEFPLQCPALDQFRLKTWEEVPNEDTLVTL